LIDRVGRRRGDSTKHRASPGWRGRRPVGRGEALSLRQQVGAIDAKRQAFDVGGRNAARLEMLKTMRRNSSAMSC
jgi:hypothetical protein